MPRAFLQLGGRSVLEWQIDIALDAGCQRVICLTERNWPQLEPIRHALERKGLQFHAISTPAQLVGLLSADQEILAIGDGVVLDRELARQALGRGRMVATVPADPAINAGFERIDGQNAWGGLLLTRAQVAEKLAEMPADSNVISLMIRLALQGGTPLATLGDNALANGELLLAQDIGSLQHREHALLNASARSASWWGPGRAVAHILARKMAPQGLDRGPIWAGIAGAVLLAASIAFTLYGTIAAAFLALALAAFAASLSRAVADLRSSLLGLGQKTRFTPIFRVLLDVSFIFSMAWPVALDTMLDHLFAPMVLVCALRLAEMAAIAKLAPLWRDRVVLGVILAAATVFGVLPEIIAIITLIALGLCLFGHIRARDG